MSLHFFRPPLIAHYYNMFKVIRLNSHPHLENSLNIQFPQHNYSTRNSNRLLTPFPRVDAIRFNFQYQFVDAWNATPLHIQESTSLRTFKRLYTNNVFNSY